MAERLFIQILNMSLTGSLVIAAVCLIRLLLRKAPSIFSYCLWAAVLFRLLCPVSFSAFFSPLNAAQYSLVEHGRIQYIPEDMIWASTPAEQTPAEDSGLPEAGSSRDALSSFTDFSQNRPALLLRAGTVIWILGVLILALYSMMTLIRLKQKMRGAVLLKDNIYLTGRIATPFVIGFIRPRIYLPALLGETEKEYILLHEQIHLRRKDHLIKAASFAALCLHWFNPLVWLAFFLSGRDMEMSCDEAVIRRTGSSVKKDYSASLLSLSTGRRIVSGGPLAFGEGDTGGRIRNILRYRKPAFLAAGAATVICAVTVTVLLANPVKPDEDTEGGAFLTFYGVIADVVREDTSFRLLLIPGIGEVEIPVANTVDTYFEPGDERDPHELLPGDLAAVTFSLEEGDIDIQDTGWPAQFSVSAESITILWQGLSLRQISNGSQMSESTCLLTFPGGVVPDISTAEAGDMLSLYWEDPEDEAYLPQVAESGASRLIARTPILAITENEAGGKMLTLGLDTPIASQILNGFGFHIRFALEPGEFLTQEDRRAAEEASAYLADSNQQEPNPPTAPAGSDGQEPNLPAAPAGSSWPQQGGSAIPGQPSNEAAVPGQTATSPEEKDTVLVNIRSVSHSSRMIDSYLPAGSFPYNSEDSLAFAEDCVFRVNYSMDSIDYREVSFDTFASLIEECPHHLNKPCALAFQDGLITEASLESAWLQYGIRFYAFVPGSYIYEYLLEEGENAFEDCFSLASTETADIADCDGSEIIEVYTGDTGDGESGIVMIKDAEGGLLCTQDAHIARAGWNNIYLGEKDGIPFLMNVYVEDRWDFGAYGYWVYRLDEKGAVRQMAGSLLDFDLGSGLLQYDDEIFKEWAGGMTSWLEYCHLLLSTQDGELRTEKVSEADKYNYDTLSLKDREL